MYINSYSTTLISIFKSYIHDKQICIMDIKTICHVAYAVLTEIVTSFLIAIESSNNRTMVEVYVGATIAGVPTSHSWIG